MKLLITLGVIWGAQIGGMKTKTDAGLALQCRSKMWSDDCKEGTKVIGTFGYFGKKYCDQICASQEGCKSFLYHDKTANCALLKVSGESSKKLGISGEDLKPIKPTPIEKKEPNNEPDDCSEFTFASCDSKRLLAKEPSSYAGYFTQRVFCFDNCDQENQVDDCKTLYYDVGDRACWLTTLIEPQNIVTISCNISRGRADSVDSKKYDDCLLKNRVKDNCLAGNCDISWLGEGILTEDASVTDEAYCKTLCGGYLDPKNPDFVCTHYEYSDDPQKCQLFDSTNKTRPDNPECSALVARKEYKNETKLNQCVANKPTPVTTESPTTDTTPSPSNWYISEDQGNCDDACKSNNLVCTIEGLRAHNDEVDSATKLKEVLSGLGIDLPSPCSGYYGQRPDMPAFEAARDNCWYTSPTKETFSCSTGTSPSGKRRLCYCHGRN